MEYRIFRDRYGKYILVSLDENDIVARDFIKEDESDDSAIIKEINPSEIGKVYSIDTFAIYKDRKLQILNEKNGKYLVWTDDPDFAKKYEFEPFDRAAYNKWIDIQDVEHVYEIKEPFPDFIR